MQLEILGAWVMVNDWPLTVIVPTRCGPLFGATEYWTIPSPTPFKPPVIVIQLTPGSPLQLHPEEVETLKEPGPPPCGEFALVGLSVETQDFSSLAISLPPA